MLSGEFFCFYILTEKKLLLFCSAKVGGEVFGIPRGKFFHGHVAFEIGDYAVDNGQLLLNLLKIRAAAVGAFFGNSFGRP